MKLKITFAVAILTLFVLLSQCKFNTERDIMPPIITAQQIAADTSFAKIVIKSNIFQRVIYNNLRDAHSMTIRKNVGKRIEQLLRYNNRDSLILAIKKSGFEDINAVLLSLEQVNKSNVNLKSNGIFLDKLPLSTVAAAYEIVSTRTKHVYPPVNILREKGSNGNTQKTNIIGICELCFLNNCDECSDYGGDTELQPTNGEGSGGGGGLNPCQDGVMRVRAASINSANAWLMVQLTAECGTVAWGAGAAACSGTAATIVGAPISPATGVGIGCVVYVGCDLYQLYQYRQQIEIIEGNYAKDMYGCK